MTAMRQHPVLIYATYPDADVAADHAHRLCKARLIACANIMAPHRAIYRWQGAVEEGTETAMILKTTTARQQDVIDWIVAEHPYDTPCVLAVDIGSVNPAFLEWIISETFTALP